jgi:FixJ family two-component response regulator
MTNDNSYVKTFLKKDEGSCEGHWAAFMEKLRVESVADLVRLAEKVDIQPTDQG